MLILQKEGNHSQLLQCKLRMFRLWYCETNLRALQWITLHIATVVIRLSQLVRRINGIWLMWRWWGGRWGWGSSDPSAMRGSMSELEKPFVWSRSMAFITLIIAFNSLNEPAGQQLSCLQIWSASSNFLKPLLKFSNSVIPRAKQNIWILTQDFLQCTEPL